MQKYCKIYNRKFLKYGAKEKYKKVKIIKILKRIYYFMQTIKIN